MIIFVLLIPLLTLVSALFLYQHNGKRQILRFDLVQFIYAFVMAPALFIWLKSFLFFLVRNELDLRLSVTNLFVLDSVFSALFLYVYAFIVIHSLTKSFKMRKLVDPLYDMFHHSEYFHLWLSHIIIYGGGLMLFTVLSLVNTWIPVAFGLTQSQFYGLLLVSVVLGVGAFASVWLSNPLQGNFMRLMKLFFALSFLSQVLAYFILDPSFRPDYVMYWMMLIVSATLILCSLVFHRSERALNWIDRLKDYKWGLNIDVLKRR